MPKLPPTDKITFGFVIAAVVVMFCTGVITSKLIRHTITVIESADSDDSSPELVCARASDRSVPSVWRCVDPVDEGCYLVNGSGGIVRSGCP